MVIRINPTGAKSPEQFRNFYGISERTWRRLKAKGDLPRLTWITPTKAIVTSENEKTWLDARSDPAPEANPFPVSTEECER